MSSCRRQASLGDFGDLGTTIGHSHGTYTATGTISAPLLQIAKTRGDEEVQKASKDQAEAKLSDSVQGVNADVRDAILDIQSSAKLVDATRSNVDLAREALDEAQQRYKAGVADSLPVSQALTSSEQANDQYISAPVSAQRRQAFAGAGAGPGFEQLQGLSG